MTLIIDTSVIVKWFVRENGHEEALRLLETSQPLRCPDFALVEAANVLRRKMRGGEVSEDQADEAIRQLPGFFDEVVPAAEILGDGFGLSKLLSHSVYDCMFLASAMRASAAVMVSADDAFLKKCAENGYAEYIRALSGQAISVDYVEQSLGPALNLLEKFQSTLDFSERSVRNSEPDEGFRVVYLADIQSASDSPIYKRLRDMIASMDPELVQQVLAICWYGRDRGSQGYERDYQNAAHLASDPAAHTPYIISNLQYFEAGLARLENDRLNKHSKSVDD